MSFLRVTLNSLATHPLSWLMVVHMQERFVVVFPIGCSWSRSRETGEDWGGGGVKRLTTPCFPLCVSWTLTYRDEISTPPPRLSLCSPFVSGMASVRKLQPLECPYRFLRWPQGSWKPIWKTTPTVSLLFLTQKWKTPEQWWEPIGPFRRRDHGKILHRP